ncbi:OmpA family protein [Maridesulfovibrio hydrothermalis]|uniref:OmpA/MotB domain protein n=1 Tax=Maridesulfovibrio hydrothermalis AM13 = DSM 14728 TaxID=1121451 RepID=L0RA29_9BACT|nr:OmpA family protein [Maridesulfovibrio hydrothermalis]CCO23614.1 OmpA/MotB domain protein [Maridesulfovibrio hydrothermalis AM13 = DSM 14728]
MHSKRLISILTLTLIAFMAIGSVAYAGSRIVLKPKVDAFAYFIDTSPSMAQSYKNTGNPKIIAGLNALKRLNNVVPELGYDSALYTMPDFATYSPKGTFSRGAMARGLSSVPEELPFFQSTPMGKGFNDLDGTISKWNGKFAVIFVSDGLANAGRNPATIVSQMSDKYGDRFCLHIVSTADTPKGIALLKRLATRTPCGVFVEASALSDKAVLDKFAQDVFYTQEEELVVEIVEEVVVAPAPVAVQEKIVFRNLNFGFDKYQITDEMVPSLTEAAALLEEYSNLKVKVGGHTDSTGPEAYNQGLSERRAKSVADWLAGNGVAADRLEVKGYGETSPKYDNTTKEGRKLNRRVELDVED